jgi:hypothetical protein
MFEQFIKERQYLQNVSLRTIEWYRESFKWLGEPRPDSGSVKVLGYSHAREGFEAIQLQ